MHIAIIGASAGIGLEAVKIGLIRNHSITALSRSPLPIDNQPSLHAIHGSATDTETLSAAIKGVDAIVVTLGTRKNLQPTTLFSDFARTLVAIHQKQLITVPVLVITGFGAGNSVGYMSWITKLLLRFLLKEVYKDKTLMEEIITGASLPWTIIRPGRLLDNSVTEQYRTETTLFKGINITGINRADVADYLIKQAENHTHQHQYVAITQ